MVIDVNDYNGFAPNLFDSIEVSKSIDLVETSIYPDARAGTPGAHGAVGLALELPAAALAPLLEEGLFVGEVATADITIGLAITGGVLGLGILVGIEAEDGTPGGTDSVPEPLLLGQLVGPGVGDDTLDAGGAAIVEAGRRELDIGSGAATVEPIESGDPHGCVYLIVAVLVFFGKVLGAVESFFVAVFGVDTKFVCCVVANETREFFLGGIGIRHDERGEERGNGGSWRAGKVVVL